MITATYAATVDELEDEWDQLADRVGAGPFVRPGWIRAWWGAFAPPRSRLRIFAVRDDDRLVGVIPLYERRGGLRSTTNEHTPNYEPLVEAGFADVVLDELFRTPRRRISLAYLDVARITIADYRHLAGQNRYAVWSRPFEASPYIDVSGDVGAYERSLSPKMLANTRRRLRHLQGEGVVTVAPARGGEVEADLAEGFMIEGSGWKSEAGTAILSQETTRRFYTEIAMWAAGRGTLALWFVRLDGRPIAFDLTLEEAGTMYLLKGGYDVAFRRYAPGKILLHAMVVHAFTAANLRKLDFCGHGEAYKLEWTRAEKEYQLLHGFGPTMAGRGEYAAYRYVRPIARRMRLRAS